MVEYLIVKAVSDTIDPFILWLAEIGAIMGALSLAISVFLLIDYFKRHGWVYSRYRKLKKPIKSDMDKDREFTIP